MPRGERAVGTAEAQAVVKRLVQDVQQEFIRLRRERDSTRDAQIAIRDGERNSEAQKKAARKIIKDLPTNDLLVRQLTSTLEQRISEVFETPYPLDEINDIFQIFYMDGIITPKSLAEALGKHISKVSDPELDETLAGFASELGVLEHRVSEPELDEDGVFESLIADHVDTNAKAICDAQLAGLELDHNNRVDGLTAPAPNPSTEERELTLALNRYRIKRYVEGFRIAHSDTVILPHKEVFSPHLESRDPIYRIKLIYISKGGLNKLVRRVQDIASEDGVGAQAVGAREGIGGRPLSVLFGKVRAALAGAEEPELQTVTVSGNDYNALVADLDRQVPPGPGERGQVYREQLARFQNLTPIPAPQPNPVPPAPNPVPPQPVPPAGQPYSFGRIFRIGLTGILMSTAFWASNGLGGGSGPYLRGGRGALDPSSALDPSFTLDVVSNTSNVTNQYDTDSFVDGHIDYGYGDYRVEGYDDVEGHDDGVADDDQAVNDGEGHDDVDQRPVGGVDPTDVDGNQTAGRNQTDAGRNQTHVDVGGDQTVGGDPTDVDGNQTVGGGDEGHDVDQRLGGDGDQTVGDGVEERPGDGRYNRGDGVEERPGRDGDLTDVVGGNQTDVGGDPTGGDGEPEGVEEDQDVEGQDGVEPRPVVGDGDGEPNGAGEPNVDDPTVVVGGDPTVGGGNQTVDGGNQTDVVGNQTGAGNQTDGGGDPTVVDGGQTGGGNQTVDGGNQTVVGGNQTVVGGNQTVVGGNQTDVDGGNQTDVDGGNQTDVVGNQTGAGNQTDGGGDPTVVDGGNQTVDGGNQTNGGNQTDAGGNPTDAGGNQTVVDGNPTDSGGNQTDVVSDDPTDVGGEPDGGVVDGQGDGITEGPTVTPVDNREPTLVNPDARRPVARDGEEGHDADDNPRNNGPNAGNHSGEDHDGEQEGRGHHDDSDDSGHGNDSQGFMSGVFTVGVLFGLRAIFENLRSRFSGNVPPQQDPNLQDLSVERRRTASLSSSSEAEDTDSESSQTPIRRPKPKPKKKTKRRAVSPLSSSSGDEGTDAGKKTPTKGKKKRKSASSDEETSPEASTESDDDSMLSAVSNELKVLRRIDRDLAQLDIGRLIWINPAFEASAKEHAGRLKQGLKALDRSCDMQLMQLSALHKREMEHAMLSPPPEDRKVLDSIKAKLHGPGAKKGIILAVDEAIANNKSMRLKSYTVSTTDYPLDSKADYLSKISVSRTPVSLTGSVYNYQLVNRIQPGFFREHVITAGDGKSLGRFIEERKKATHAKGSDQITMTFTDFPDGEEHFEERAFSAMAMVTQFVSGLKEAPSSENPLYLRGSDEDELQCIGAALMLIGKNMPDDRKFGAEVIQFGKPLDFSQHETHFNQCPKVQLLIKEATQMLQDKFAHENDSLKAQNKLGQMVAQLNSITQKPSEGYFDETDEDEDEDEDDESRSLSDLGLDSGEEDDFSRSGTDSNDDDDEDEDDPGSPGPGRGKSLSF